MNSQLLCTFSTIRDYESALIQISSTYDIVFDKIYVLQNVDNDYQMYLTYNADMSDGSEFLPKTISMHRKKQTNTLYTINALNNLVMRENNGVRDESFEVDWEKYRNSIILTSDEGVKVVPTQLFKIINL